MSSKRCEQIKMFWWIPVPACRSKLPAGHQEVAVFPARNALLHSGSRGVTQPAISGRRPEGDSCCCSFDIVERRPLYGHCGEGKKTGRPTLVRLAEQKTRKTLQWGSCETHPCQIVKLQLLVKIVAVECVYSCSKFFVQIKASELNVNISSPTIKHLRFVRLDTEHSDITDYANRTG